ncbi:hypothetical protein [Mycobacterium paragordonae]|uniref:hypothetical protein n=1 Tax=Mycobacterium paragordonae TaxID=1389713 RepID=UPI0013C52061|nr:hypothetical protein [Mycobacterium paragordonae]
MAGTAQMPRSHVGQHLVNVVDEGADNIAVGLIDGDIGVQKMLTGVVQVVAQRRFGGGSGHGETFQVCAEQFTLSSRGLILRMKPQLERGARYWD